MYVFYNIKYSLAHTLQTVPLPFKVCFNKLFKVDKK